MIRRYKTSDCKALADLFQLTVRTTNAKDYSTEQIDAWVGDRIDFQEWDESLRSCFTVVAELGGAVAGFGDIDGTGYLDRLFVHPDYQHQGIATAICDVLEKSLPATVPFVTVHASITARGFFEQRGYTVVSRQAACRGGVALEYYAMELRRDGSK